jgi:hypothetical protein
VRSEVQVLLDPPACLLLAEDQVAEGYFAQQNVPKAFTSWGLSSAGRAPDLHSGGQEFDPPRLHQRFSIESLSTSECLAVQSDDIALFLRKLRLTSYREISKSTLLVTASKRITSDWCPSGRALGKIVSSISSKVCQPEKDSVVQVKYTNQAQDRTVLS